MHSSVHLPRTLAAAGLAVALLCGFVAPARADSLDDIRDRAARAEARAKREVASSKQKVGSAASRLSASRTQLANARVQLALTRNKLALAKAADKRMALKLKKATVALAAAKVAVVKGQQDIAAHKLLIGEVVRSQYQDHSELANVAVLFENSSMGDLNNRLQWSTTLFDTSQARMDTLNALQTKLEAAKKKQAAAEKKVAAERKAAATALAATRALEKAATEQASAIAGLVQVNAANLKAANAELDADRKAYKAETRERQAVEQRIAARIARQKAEAARQRREAARLKRIAVAKARAAAIARKKNASNAAAKTRIAERATKRASRASSRVSYGGGGGWSRPSGGPLTSPYGMRFHPVLRYWKLHDGMDFGAGCGTAIRAARSGVVSERYYNAGYGNRLLIDHGAVGGTYYTTAYNHATHYTVSVGQRVSAGEVIGYVGSTGYSTGCHLHFMVYRNGGLINPATIL